MTTPLASIAQPSAAVAGVRDLNRLLDHLHEVDDGEVGPEEHEELVTGYERAARKLESLRLREVARADTARVADKVGLAD
ncbi:MAG: hypothetical protein JWP74_109, partial [Marmoricola sp.]|nr:hypothetical protein [Marmoricola sp.]